MLFEFILLKGVRFSVRSLKKKADANNAKSNNEFFIFLGIKFHKYHLILFSPLALVGRRWTMFKTTYSRKKWKMELIVDFIL